MLTYLKIHYLVNKIIITQ